VAKNTGLKINRKYTSPGDPYKDIVWEKRSSKITNPDGSVVFEMNDVEIPSTWSQVATDIMVSKYFRKAGVPQTDESGNELKDDNGDVVLGPETSSKQYSTDLQRHGDTGVKRLDICIIERCSGF